MKMSKPIIAVLILGLFNNLFKDDLAWFMFVYIATMQLSIISATLFESIKRKEILNRSIVLVFTFYVCVEAQMSLVYYFIGYNSYLISFSIMAFIFWTLFIFTRYKQYSFPSDKICNTNYYICFWKPKTTMTLFWSLSGWPIGGVSIYCPMQWWGHKWRKTTYMTEDLTPKAITKSFVVIDTGICSMTEDGKKIKSLLNSLVGTPAGLFRIRCIHTIKEVLKMFGGKFAVKNKLGYFPSLYFKGICEWK